MGVLLALLAAASFGLSDVTGAVAARRVSALTVTLAIQAVGLLALLPVLLLVAGTPSRGAWVYGALAGAAGTTGLVVYLRAMAAGPIGVVSPVAALVGAAVPVGWGVLLAGDQVGLQGSLGILLGLVAVGAVAYVPNGAVHAASGATVLAALLSGVAFGLFFVALDATPPGSGLWPLLGARIVAVAIMVGAVVLRGRPLLPHGVGRLTAISGVADVAGNALFLLATRVGLLSLVGLLTSLYPVVALLVARWWLQERLTGLQAAGVGAAMAATGLLAAAGA